MRKNKKIDEVPENMTIEEASEFWNTHSFVDYPDIKEVHFEVDIESEKTYFAIERDLAQKISEVAKARGVSAETLLNLWVKEKLLEFA